MVQGACKTDNNCLQSEKKDGFVKISIEYCTKWNYEPRASSLGDVLAHQYGAEVKLIASEGGVFEVVVDGNLIFSKKELNRFPEEGEVEGLLASYSWGWIQSDL